MQPTELLRRLATLVPPRRRRVMVQAFCRGAREGGVNADRWTTGCLPVDRHLWRGPSLCRRGVVPRGARVRRSARRWRTGDRGFQWRWHPGCRGHQLQRPEHLHLHWQRRWNLPNRPICPSGDPSKLDCSRRLQSRRSSRFGGYRRGQCFSADRLGRRNFSTSGRLRDDGRSSLRFGAPNYRAGFAPSSVAVGDFNNDHIPDLAVANYGAVAVLLGNEDGTFQPAVEYGQLAVSNAVAVADFDADGAQDIVVTQWSTNAIALLQGVGDGTFRTPIEFHVTGNPLGLSAADFNGDGIPDLAVAGTSGEISIFLGRKGESWNGSITTRIGLEPLGSFGVGDFNRDGILDLAVTSQNTDEIAVLLGNGDGTFGTAVRYQVGHLPTSIAAGDFNGDGLLDLVVVNASSGSISLLLGDGEGGFRVASDYSVGGEPDWVAAGDFNFDGIQDVAVTTWRSGEVFVFLGSADDLATDRPVWNRSVYGLGCDRRFQSGWTRRSRRHASRRCRDSF